MGVEPSTLTWKRRANSECGYKTRHIRIGAEPERECGHGARHIRIGAEPEKECGHGARHMKEYFANSEVLLQKYLDEEPAVGTGCKAS